uniref:Anti-sigma factor n=1 Tax=Chryseobacterium endophyticum TaxID=1854762 RepID=A0AAU6WM89_9FLAO
MQKINQKMEMVTNPDMKMVMLKGVEKHADSKAMVFWDTKTKAVYLDAEKLPKAPEGMQYQLWAIADGKPVDAGMYTEEKIVRLLLPTSRKHRPLPLPWKSRAEVRFQRWKICM